AFVAVEVCSTTTSSGAGAGARAGAGAGDQDQDNRIVFHCLMNSSGSVYEFHQGGDLSKPSGGALMNYAAGVSPGTHLCADAESSLLIRRCRSDVITGWWLLPNGSRSPGAAFSFALGGPRAPTALHLGSGGLILAISARPGAVTLWDLRHFKMRQRQLRRASPLLPLGSSVEAVSNSTEEWGGSISGAGTG
ncbi:unnamed protein product, partial [Discosporangium mesarthrocarpum]